MNTMSVLVFDNVSYLFFMMSVLIFHSISYLSYSLSVLIFPVEYLHGTQCWLMLAPTATDAVAAGSAEESNTQSVCLTVRVKIRRTKLHSLKVTTYILKLKTENLLRFYMCLL